MKAIEESLKKIVIKVGCENATTQNEYIDGLIALLEKYDEFKLISKGVKNNQNSKRKKYEIYTSLDDKKIASLIAIKSYKKGKTPKYTISAKFTHLQFLNKQSYSLAHDLLLMTSANFNSRGSNIKVTHLNTKHDASRYSAINAQEKKSLKEKAYECYLQMRLDIYSEDEFRYYLENVQEGDLYDD